jgi:hypothetical protein
MLIDGVYEEVDAEKAKKMLLEAHSSQLNEVKITLLEGFFNKLAKGKK